MSSEYTLYLLFHFRLNYLPMEENYLFLVLEPYLKYNIKTLLGNVFLVWLMISHMLPRIYDPLDRLYIFDEWGKINNFPFDFLLINAKIDINIMIRI